MKTLLLTIVFLAFNTFSLAQSVYLDTLENAFSVNASFGAYEDITSGSVGIGFTLNSTLNFGASYLFGTIQYEDEEYNGNGYGGSVSFTPVSEARGNLVGVDIGLFFTNLVYARDLSLTEIETNSYGIGVFVTERVSKKHNPQALLFQFGATMIPVSEAIVFEGSFFKESIVAPLQIQLYFSPTIQFRTGESAKIVIEPAIIHEIEFDLTFFSIGVQALF